MLDFEPEADWRTRAADLFEQHGESVAERLAQRNPSVDREELHDAFITALLEIAGDPDRFDATRGTNIEDFLVGAAQRSLLAILRTDGRRKSREEKRANLSPTASRRQDQFWMT